MTGGVGRGVLRLVVVHAGVERDVEVGLDPRTSTVAALARHLGDRDTTALAADGRVLPPELPVAAAGLRSGTTVRPVRPDPWPAAGRPLLEEVSPSDAVVELHVVGGTTAGARFPLRPGVTVIGRERHADVVLAHPTVSAAHARLTVAVDGACTIEDLGGHNGTRVDGAFVERPRTLHPGQLVELGAVTVALRPPRSTTGAPRTPEPGRATVAFNRPPRPRAPAAPPPVGVPAAPDAPAGAGTPFGWATLAAPLVLGLALALFVDARMALFTLLSPLMVVGTWAEERRRARRGRADGRRELDRRLAGFAHELDEAVRHARARAEAELPDPAEVCTRAVTYDTRLWERRRTHPDALRLRLGVATVELDLPLAAPADPAPEALARARRATWCPRSPAAVDLGPGQVLGVVGEPTAALPLLRWLVVAAAVTHGPADLRIAVLAERPGDWRWAAWLPHTRGLDRPDVTLVSPASEADPAVLAELGAAAARDGGVPTLLVVDAADLARGRGPDAALRGLLREQLGALSVIVTAAAPRDLPDRCTRVVTLDGEHGAGRVDAPGGGAVDDLVVAGIPGATARRVARSLAGLDDPDATGPDGELPERVRLLELLGLDRLTPEAVRQRWEAAGTTVASPIGSGVDGPVVVDLVRDGPHGLVGGTTGSGKSELLRTLVAGLAASADPAHLNLVLIDYKGGAAFDACAGLPHTVGVVTDLDDHLAARALTCLEAELRWRERRLREAGASDLPAYLAGADDPLPRLVVVVDEFAALAAELPDFVAALVDVAQRGRSLGVHLLLATQRPSGVISESIRANTDLRIALRMQDRHDSTDVVGCDLAAAIPRHRPGRGLLARAGGAPAPFQTATVTDGPPAAAAAIVSRPLASGAEPPAPPDGADGHDGNDGNDGHDVAPHRTGPTDLERLVAACRDAARGWPEPRQPWPPPLPAHLTPADLPERPAGGTDAGAAGAVVIGLADEPAAQRQAPFRLDPDAGAVAVVGAPGSGTGEVVAAVTLALARHHAPDDLHVHVIAAGTAPLGALRDLPHTGTYVGPRDADRLARLIRLLHGELEARRAAVTAGEPLDAPRLVVVIDGYATLVQACDDAASYRRLEQLERIVADGAAVGITALVTADRPGGLPVAVAAAVATTLVLRLTDPLDWAAYGVTADRIPPPLPGRGIDAGTGREVQLATAAADDLPAAVARVTADTRPPRRRPPLRVRTLPEVVALDDVLTAGADTGDGTWDLPVGLADHDLAPALLPLGPGDHALVAGPARSGRSTAVAALATAAVHHLPGLAVTVIAPRPSPLTALRGAHVVTDTSAVPQVCGALAGADGPQLVVVDDAELVEDPTGALGELLALRRPDLRAVAAGRVDALRSCYAPWLAEIRRTRLGLALRPNPDTDGLLWDLQLPRTGPAVWPVGRGFLIDDGRPVLFQAARP